MSGQRNSSRTHTFSDLSSDAILLEEVLHRGCNFDNVCFECEEARVKKLNLRVRYLFAKRFGSGGNKERIVLAPDCKQRWFRLAEIFLKFRIESYVRGIVQQQIELDFFISGTLKQRQI